MDQQQNNLYSLIKYFEFINKNLKTYKDLGIVKEPDNDVTSFLALLYEIRVLLIAKNPSTAIDLLIKKYPKELPPCGGILRNVLFYYKEHPDLDYDDNLNNETLMRPQENPSGINDEQYHKLIAKLEHISNIQIEHSAELLKLQECNNELEDPSSMLSEFKIGIEKLYSQFMELKSNLLSVHNNMLETKKIAKESLDGVDTKFRNYSDAFNQTVKEVPRLVEQSQISLFRNILSKEIEEMTTAVNAFMKKYDQIYLSIDHKMQQNIEKNNLLIQQSIDVQREKIITHFAAVTKKFLILITGVSIIAAAGIGFVSAKYVEHSFISTLSDIANAAKNKK